MRHGANFCVDISPDFLIPNSGKSTKHDYNNFYLSLNINFKILVNPFGQSLISSETKTKEKRKIKLRAKNKLSKKVTRNYWCYVEI